MKVKEFFKNDGMKYGFMPLELIISIICLLVFLWTFISASYVETHYSMTCTVEEISGSEVILKDTTGNKWEIEADGLNLNETIKAVFDDNGTTDRTDDKVIRIVKRG